MAWIKIVDEQEATGDLAAYYDEAHAQGRRIVNVHSVLSLNPGAMRAIDAFQRSWREDGVLSGRHREMVALVTSALNRCHY
ncbi:MAG: carboxymuconolactone decarboxylase family protein [SAR202 cluster bacterium]|jgi:alkylhydroperoxidase family enzyme|nr:carboxymuconolactone decarboxylase family protein [SAR202 cluster bacterium]MDP6665199.1 carboxymuconolactone decarboxylase family protein [SAR202 cluster bacterium]MDP6800670.1 carboxymuconolactone decarboxylase family protein [SAR202 cluster bacterium]|tara:strand:- start:535 stop:777 length:243 start_codon:yes stop_codon:yes gene_type:complete